MLDKDLNVKKKKVLFSFETQQVTQQQSQLQMVVPQFQEKWNGLPT